MVENGYPRNIVLGLIDKLNKAFLVLKIFDVKIPSKLLRAKKKTLLTSTIFRQITGNRSNTSDESGIPEIGVTTIKYNSSIL